MAEHRAGADGAGTAAAEGAREGDRLRGILDSLPHISWTAGPDGRVGFTNRAAYLYAGLPEGDVRARRRIRWVHPGDRRRTARAWNGARASGLPYEVEYRLRRADGAFRWHLERGVPVRDAEGRVVEWVGTTLEVHDRRTAEEALRETAAALRYSGERLGSILDSIPAHVAVLDGSGNILSVNEAWRAFGRRNGLPAGSDGVGGNYLDACASARGPWAEGAQDAADGIRAVLEGGEAAFEMEYPCHAPGESRWFRLMAAPLAREGERGAVVMHVDVTERRRAVETARARVRQQAVVATLGERALSGIPWEGLVGEAAFLVPLTLGVDLCEILECRNGGGTLLLRAGTGFEEGLVGSATVDGGGSSQAGFTLQSGGPVTVEDLAAETRFQPSSLLRESGAVAGISVPIGLPGRNYGVLGAWSRRPFSFRREDARFLVSVANVLGIARQRDLSVEDAERFFALSRDILVIADAGGVALRASPSCERILGWKPAEIEGRNFRDLVHPEDLAAAVEARGRPDAAGAYSFEGRWRHRDGSWRRLDWHGSMDPVGGRAYAVARDETRRREEERILRESESRFRALADGSPDFIWTSETGAARNWFNGPWLRMRGRTLEQEAGMGWLEGVHPEDREGLLEALDEARRSGGTFEMEYRLRDADGAWRRVLDRGNPGSGGAPGAADPAERMIVGSCVDITERRSLEERLRQSQKMEAVGRLAGGVAHDFNNLLTAIIGFSDLLEARLGADPAARGHIRQIRSAGERAARLTQELLAFGRKQVLRPEVLDLNQVVAEAVRLLRRLIPENVEVEFRPCAGSPGVLADRVQVHQVLLNLALNARDAMPGGGRFLMETAVEDGAPEGGPEGEGEGGGEGPRGRRAVLVLSDTGPGMDEETRRHLFEPFFTTKAKGKGTGLGLSTVYGIVRQSGGSLEVRSAPGAGTTFRILLPLRGEAAAGPEGRAGPERADRPAARGETILLVEDETAVRDFARTALVDAGFRVLAAASGADAVEAAGRMRGGLDLLLTDVVMPGMNGRETAEAIRALHPGAAVLFMSGYTDAILSHQGLVEGGVDLLSKPFSPAVLARRVRQALDLRAPGGGGGVPAGCASRTTETPS